MKEIAILGSTGSIGTQALDVIANTKDLFHVAALACHKNIDLLKRQAEQFNPYFIGITDEEAGKKFLQDYSGTASVFIGKDSLMEIVKQEKVETVLVSVVGVSGLRPTLRAIEYKKNIALANKETLVAGGKLVKEAIAKYKVPLLPVDSEHSAIFQSMLGQDKKGIRRILLTASGGPFRGKTVEELAHVTVQEAMKHPTWNMGMKVTLDSATMFNKGLEVIEAHWLFDISYDDIEVVVQPQSIIHSMVEYVDGTVIAQLGLPDMRLPIQFAFTYPNRIPSPSKQFMDWKTLKSIQIEEPNMEVFRSLKLAFDAGKQGGDTTTVFNAANEEAIRAFIDHRISFLSIFDVVESSLDHWESHEITSIDDVFHADQMARELAKKYIKEFSL